MRTSFNNVKTSNIVIEPTGVTKVINKKWSKRQKAERKNKIQNIT